MKASQVNMAAATTTTTTTTSKAKVASKAAAANNANPKQKTQMHRRSRTGWSPISLDALAHSCRDLTAGL